MDEQLEIRLLNATCQIIYVNGLRGYKSALEKYYETRNVAFEAFQQRVKAHTVKLYANLVKPDNVEWGIFFFKVCYARG